MVKNRLLPSLVVICVVALLVVSPILFLSAQKTTTSIALPAIVSNESSSNNAAAAIEGYPGLTSNDARTVKAGIATGGTLLNQVVNSSCKGNHFLTPWLFNQFLNNSLSKLSGNKPEPYEFREVFLHSQIGLAQSKCFPNVEDAKIYDILEKIRAFTSDFIPDETLTLDQLKTVLRTLTDALISQIP